mmetsp:Transcript_121231/g.270995  ORF Transcript_121231/g.270995 Transcript_121231/m.270995 type:complete len:201 (-) Transcript_121231:1029-1631(-)
MQNPLSSAGLRCAATPLGALGRPRPLRSRRIPLFCIEAKVLSHAPEVLGRLFRCRLQWPQVALTPARLAVGDTRLRPHPRTEPTPSRHLHGSDAVCLRSRRNRSWGAVLRGDTALFRQASLDCLGPSPFNLRDLLTEELRMRPQGPLRFALPREGIRLLLHLSEVLLALRGLDPMGAEEAAQLPANLCRDWLGRTHLLWP